MAKWNDKKKLGLTKGNKKKFQHKFKEGESRLEDEFELPEMEWEELCKNGYFMGRVVEVQKKYVFISPENKKGKIYTHDVWLATIAKKYWQTLRNERNFLAVGDKVLCTQDQNSPDPDNDDDELPRCVVEYRAPRVSKISRLDPMTQRREHVLAANITQLVIVTSFCAPKIKWGLIDRYLVLAEEQGLPSVIIINKLDLLAQEDADFQKECEECIQIYRSLGYQVLVTQANMDKVPRELAQVFKKQISLLSGHSGVGKSSIINLLNPEIEQDVETESILSKGRHTTTYASFIELGTGGYVIDTPGIRSFLIPEQGAIELSSYFIEMKKYRNLCKFRECSHKSEPECAIIKAVEAGEISKLRYKSYLGILLGATGREGRTRDLE